MRRLAALLVTLAVGAGLVGSCTEQPLEPVVGPNFAPADSTQFLAARMSRGSLMLTDDVLTACGPGLCTFTPTDYQCGGDKVECSTQTEAVEVAISTAGLPTTLRVFGDPGAHGAVLCNGTMGTVHVFDAGGVEVDVVPMVPTEPEDCGPDNLTYAAEATIQHAEGIGHIVIEPMSPFTFPIEGGTGIASAFYRVQYAGILPPVRVTCPATLQRGATGICTVTKDASAGSVVITEWNFQGDAPDEDVTRATNVSATSWSGTLVLPGKVLVVATVNGALDSLMSNHIDITPRNWTGLHADPAVLVVNDADTTLRLPIRPEKIDSQLGGSLLGVAWAGGSVNASLISDGGPNDGFVWLSGPLGRADMIVGVNRPALSYGSLFYNYQPTRVRAISGSRGTAWNCDTSRVVPMVPYIEAHEGITLPAPQYSHTGIFTQIIDTLVPLRTESVAGPLDLFSARRDTAIAVMRRQAKAVSDAMDGDISKNNLRSEPDGDMQIFSPACQFKFFPPPKQHGR